MNLTLPTSIVKEYSSRFDYFPNCILKYDNIGKKDNGKIWMWIWYAQHIKLTKKIKNKKK